jgi:hypothetical protein
MRLLSRLDDERKSGAIWYAIFRQSPYQPMGSQFAPMNGADCSITIL